MEITPETMRRWVSKLQDQDDETLADLAWDTFSSAVPTTGLNAKTKLGSLVVYLTSNLVETIESAGEDGKKAAHALKELALSDKHAIDIHLACVVAGFIASHMLNMHGQIPLGDLAAITILAIRKGPALLGR